MALDSKAWFEERLVEMALGHLLPEISRRGWATAGNFGFAAPYQHGMGDPSVFIKTIVEPLCWDKDAPEAAALRRLQFECFTMTCADTRRRLHRSDDDPPARLPDPEKESRRKRLSNKLVGIELEGDHDPAHCLIDLAYEAWEKNRLEFIP